MSDADGRERDTASARWDELVDTLRRTAHAPTIANAIDELIRARLAGLRERLEAVPSAAELYAFAARLEAVEKAQTELYDSLRDAPQPIQQGARDRWSEMVRRLQEAEVTTRWLAWHSDEKQQARTKNKAGETATALDNGLTSIESQLAWALTEPDLREIIRGAVAPVQQGARIGNNEHGEGYGAIADNAPTAPEDASDPEDSPERILTRLLNRNWLQGADEGDESWTWADLAESPWHQEAKDFLREHCADRRTPSVQHSVPDGEANPLPRNADLPDILEAGAKILRDQNHPDSFTRRLIAGDMEKAASALRSQGGQEPVAWTVEHLLSEKWELVGLGSTSWPTEAEARAWMAGPDLVGCTLRLVPLYRHPVREDAGREREEAVERVAKWLYREQRSRTEWPIASKAVRESYRDDARRLLSECFPSPDQGAEP